MVIEFESRDAILAVDESTLPEVIATIRRKVVAQNRSHGNLMVAAAYATHAAFRIDESMSVSKFATEVKANRTTAYMWKRLGVAVVDLGVETNTDDWTRLAGRSGATSYPVAHVLDGKGRAGTGKVGEFTPTREDLDWALGMLFKKDTDGNLTDEKLKTADVKEAVAKDLDPDYEPGDDDAQQGIDKNAQVYVKWLGANIGKVSDEVLEKVAADLFKAISVKKVQDAMVVEAEKARAKREKAVA